MTNTHSVGIARDATIEWQYEIDLFDPIPDSPEIFWSLPVVTETYDGGLNDINGSTVYELPHDRVVEILKNYRRIP